MSDGISELNVDHGPKNIRPHWYKQYLGACPVCGSDKSYRERVYGEKPTKPEDCYEYMSDGECYDWCEI